MLQTLKEIDAQEQAARTRAWKFGKLREEAEKTSSRLTSLEARLAAPQAELQVMLDLQANAQKLPSGLIVRGNPLLSDGGQDLRYFILREAGFAINQMAEQRKALEAELPAARSAAADALTRLAEFEFETGR